VCSVVGSSVHIDMLKRRSTAPLVQLLCCWPTLDEVVKPLPLIAAAVREALQAPAPAMILLEVAFVHSAMFVGGLASPAGSKRTVEQKGCWLCLLLGSCGLSALAGMWSRRLITSVESEVVQYNTLQVVRQAYQLSGNAPMGHVFLPLALVADAAGKCGSAPSMALVILPGTIIGVTVRAGMLAAAVPQGVQDLTLHVQPCNVSWLRAVHVAAGMSKSKQAAVGLMTLGAPQTCHRSST
jgi:hypothetical protein